MNLMFINLAASDLTETLLGTWIEFFLYLTHQKQKAGSFVCDFYGFGTFASGKYRNNHFKSRWSDIDMMQDFFENVS